MEIHFFPEGRVDAYLIESNGLYGFVDAGFRADGLSCVKRLRAIGVERLEWYVGTHAHKNHIGGAAPIIEAFRPRCVYMPHERVRERILRNAKTLAERRAIFNTEFVVRRPGDTFWLGPVRFDVLGPLKVLSVNPGLLGENLNSLVVRATAPSGGRLLMTGDTSASILQAIERAHAGALQADCLKNPHHNASLPADLLHSVAPQTVVVCNNTRPGAAYRKRIAAADAKLLTACPKWLKGDGTVHIVLD